MIFLPMSGTHHHPPPECVGASTTALRELATKTKENGGSWTALQLVAGLKGKHKKTSISEADPKFNDRVYVARTLQNLQRKSNIMATGSAIGPNTIDGCFQVFQDFLKTTKQFIYKAGLAPDPYICIATEAMQNVLAQATNPFVTDSVEAVIQPTFYQGQVMQSLMRS
jgi:hypothetical protein